MTQATKTEIIALLRAFAEQRPGMDPRDYGDWSSYRSESRSVTRDLHEARTLLRAVEWRDSITADMLREAFRAYSGRLTLDETGDRPRLDYCTGQYFPTEYRRAVCAVCASALWSYFREHCMPAPVPGTGNQEGCEFYPTPGKSRQLCSAGDWLRITFRREFGARIARRWFD